MNMKTTTDRRPPLKNGEHGDYIPVIAFQAVHFHDKKEGREVILLYALDENGIIREFNGTSWKSFPISH